MNNQQLSATAKKAHKAVGSITSRHGANFERRLLAGASPDPDESEEEEMVSSETEFQIWKLLPQLKGVPENFLEKLPLSAMFQLNSALQKERKNTEKLGVNVRLAQNAKKAVACPATTASGLDNRRDLLHKARFLGGACSSLTDQWAAARAAIGETGVVALGCYDLEAVGCGGSVTQWNQVQLF